jgi:hypothetical protein
VEHTAGWGAEVEAEDEADGEAGSAADGAAEGVADGETANGAGDTAGAAPRDAEPGRSDELLPSEGKVLIPHSTTASQADRYRKNAAGIPIT